MKELKLISIIVISAFLFSCEDDPIDPVGNNSAMAYMPMEVGNEWVYYNTYEDEDGNEIVGDPDYESWWDTLRVVESAEYEGRAAFRITTSTSNGDEVFDQWYSADEDDLYVFRSVDDFESPIDGTDGLLPELDIESKWIKVFSMDNEQVQVDEFEIPEFNLIFFTMSGEVVIDLKTESVSDYSYNGKSYNARMATGISEFEGELTIPEVPLPQQINGTDYEESIYAEGIGMVEVTSYSEFTEIAGFPSAEDEPIFKSYLRSHIIK